MKKAVLQNGVAAPASLPGLWLAKLTDGHELGNYSYVTYPEEGEAYCGNGFVYSEGVARMVMRRF